jgi:hypothetical protein
MIINCPQHIPTKKENPENIQIHTENIRVRTENIQVRTENIRACTENVPDFETAQFLSHFKIRYIFSTFSIYTRMFSVRTWMFSVRTRIFLVCI